MDAKPDYYELMQRVKTLENKLASTKHILTQHKSSHRCYRLLLENLGKIDRAIKQEIDIEQMLKAVLETVFGIFRCDRAWILYPCDPEAGSFCVPMEVNRLGYPGANVLKLKVQMTSGNAQAMREALASDRPLMHGKGTGMAWVKEDGGRFGVQSEMLKAIHTKRGKPWLFGMHQCSHARVWTAEEQHLFNEIGCWISDGLTSLLAFRKLKENEQLFRAVFEQAAVGVALCDSKTGHIVKVNKKYSDIVGYGIDELCQSTYLDMTHPDDIDKHFGDFQLLIENKTAEFALNRRYCRKDGSVVWGRMTVSPMWKKGEAPDQYIAILQDITEQKKAENKLKSSERKYKDIFNNLLDVYIETALDGTILEASPSAEELSGYQKEELIGTKVQDHYADKEKRDELLKILFSKGMVRSFEADGIHKDGRRVSFSMTARLVKDSMGHPVKLIGMLRDITEQKKAAMQLQRVQKLETIGTLASGIAHDFNNIMSGILSYAQLAKMHLNNPDEAENDIAGIQKAGEKATELVHQILTLSRRQSNHQKKPLEVYIVVQEALKLLRAAIPATIKIKETIASKAKVMANSIKIHQVIMNLATNAYHAMKDKKGILSIGLKEISISKKYHLPELDLSPGKYLRLDVSDTGCGMDSTLMKKIFDPYFTTKEPDKGTGLGLAVVLSIVEEHKGKINVRSKSGAGSSFHVYLPILEE